MCGVSAAVSFSKARSTSSRNGVPESDSTSERLKYKRAELGQGQAGRQPLERLTVDDPSRAAVVARAVVVDGEAGFLERLEVAPDRPRRHAALGGEFVDRHAGGARTLDLAQDAPLPDHFSVAGHADPRIARFLYNRR